MFCANRWLCIVPLLLLVGCSRPSDCCRVIPPRDQSQSPNPVSIPTTSQSTDCCCEAAAPGDAKSGENVDVKPVGPNSVPMFGGTINRNLANAVEKNIPDTWSIEEGQTDQH